MKKIFIISILFLNSCSLLRENGIEIRIENNTNQPINNIKCYTSERLETIEMKTIQPNKKISKFLSMKNNTQDGSYILEYFNSDNKKIIKKEGYYSNGASFNQWIQYTIKEDTVLVKLSKSNISY